MEGLHLKHDFQDVGRWANQYRINVWSNKKFCLNIVVGKKNGYYLNSNGEIELRVSLLLINVSSMLIPEKTIIMKQINP